MLTAIQPPSVWSMQKTTVLISKTPPFQREMLAFERLNLKLIEAFAKKFQLEIDYIAANETFSELFNTENRFKEFIKSIQGL